MPEQIREKMRRRLAPAAALAALVAPTPAAASFLSGDTLDAAANVVAWVVIVFVPLALIGLFFYVHVLPEVIAERQQHPHKKSIKVQCILSLFFGGMLWPFAWLWAYTKPIGYRAIYGTERHDDYYVEMGEKAERGELSPAEVEALRAELADMATKGSLSPALAGVRRHLDELSIMHMHGAAHARKEPAPAGGSE
jgi:hypothetical protein